MTCVLGAKERREDAHIEDDWRDWKGPKELETKETGRELFSASSAYKRAY